MIEVNLKKMETLKDFIALLDLPINPFTMVLKNCGRELQIIFDTDNQTLVDESMNIIMQYFPSYIQNGEFTQKTKKKVLEELGYPEKYIKKVKE